MIIQIFLSNVLRMILCPAHVRKNMITQISKKKFIATLNKHAPKKIKTFWGNQKPHVSKTLRKAIMKRSQLKNKADKTRHATDILNYKKQINYVGKLNNQCKKDHFDRLNPEKDSNTFSKSCKPYANHTF